MKLMLAREAKIEDMKALQDLVLGMMDYHRSIDDGYKSAEGFGDLRVYIKAWLKDQNIKVFIAEEGGQIFGYLRASVNESPDYLNEPLYGMIDDVFVDQVNRRGGAAISLFEKAKEWFLKRGMSRVELNVHVKNPIAVALWKKLGFKDYKMRMKMDL